MTPHQRTVLRQLRDDYGVTDAVVGYGGKHPYVRFAHGGRRHRLTVATRAADPVAVANWTRQTLHAKLGPPTRSPEEKIGRRMEDMMPAIGPASPTKCRVALYKNGKHSRIRFNLPDAFGWAGGVSIKTLGTDAWELQNDPSAKRGWRRGDIVDTLQVEYNDPEPFVGEPFGSSPAEVVEVDGRLLVTCPVATRVTVQVHAPRSEKRVITPHSEELVRAKEKADIVTNKLLNDTFFARVPSMRDRMLAVLREIAAIEAIEAEPKYHLARVVENGDRVWEWRAAPVRLED